MLLLFNNNNAQHIVHKFWICMIKTSLITEAVSFNINSELYVYDGSKQNYTLKISSIGKYIYHISCSSEP